MPPRTTGTGEEGTTKALWLATFMGFSIGAWMILDGTHRLVTGDYIRMEGQLGPWAPLVATLGIDPMSMAFPFILIGALWLLCCAGLLLKRRWGWQGAFALSVVSVLYCCIGTLFAIVALAALALKRTRRVFKQENNFNKEEEVL